MSQAPVVQRVGYVAIGVTDLDAAVSFATDLMGMRVTVRPDGHAYLALGEEHHSLLYIDGDACHLDHLGLEAAGPEALAEIRARVARAGYEVIQDSPLVLGVSDGFAFAGPEGFAYHVYVGMERVANAHQPTGLRPSRLGHVTLNPRDPELTRQFLMEVLDFRLSDTIKGAGFFLRCNSEHHGVGLLKGRGTFHHSAWQVQSVADLGHLGDLLDGHGRHLLWGPVRHGAGHNIAAYFPEPGGSVVEYYTDMEHIYDEVTFQPRTWDSQDRRWVALWAPGRPEGFRDYGLVPRDRPRIGDGSLR
jgi:catechol-2,3-dioxygenase